MKKLFLCSILFLLLMSGMAHATLMTIGTATYNGSEYNLIWDDDNNGNSVVWLDYTNTYTTWANQVNWATGLDDDLTINLYDGYTLTWDDDYWRLPTTVDGSPVYGYEGDPDNDGSYTYTYGYNLANSEMGHLFYEELGNLGYYDTSGNVQSGYGLTKTGDFENLIGFWYFSGTEYALNTSFAWNFTVYVGRQNYGNKTSYGDGLAVRGGQVSVSTAPEEPGTVPEPTTFLLFGLGILGLAGASRKKTA